MKGFERRLIILTMTSHALVHFFELAFPPVLTLVSDDYNLGLAGAGGLANIFPLFFGLGAIPAGMIVDRFGSRRTILTYLLVASLAGFMVLFVYPLWGLALLMLVMGFAAGLYHPAGLALISKHIKRVGLGMGLHGVGGNLGVALAPAFAATVAYLLGWRAVYATLAIPGLLIALLWLRLDRELWEGASNQEEDKGVGAQLAAPEQCRASSAPTPATGNRAATIFWTPMILLFVLQIFNGFCYRGVLTFFPTFFSETFRPGVEETSLLAAGGLTTAILIIGVVGQYLGGLAADRWRSDLIYAACFSVATPMLFLLYRLVGWYAVLSAAGFAFLYFGTQPVGNKLLAQLTPAFFRGRAFGIFFFANFGLGSFSASISGWIGEHYGIESIFIFLGLVLLAVSLTGWILVAILNKRTGGSGQFEL